MVSSARNAPSPTVVIVGKQQHRRRLDVAADLGAERAQPHGREQARVQREQERAGGVQQPLGRPDLPADAAAHRVVAPRAARCRAAARRPASAARSDDEARRASPTARRRSAPQRGVAERVGAAHGAADDEQPRRPRRPAAAATSSADASAVREHPAACARRRLGRARAPGAADPRGAGEPDQRSLGGHLAEAPPSPARSRRPGRSRRRAAACCGSRRSRPRRSRIRPTRSDVAVDPVAGAGRPRARSRRRRRSSACR